MTDVTPSTEQKPAKEYDDLTVMNRIAALMKRLPEADKARVAQWVAQRWGK